MIKPSIYDLDTGMALEKDLTKARGNKPPYKSTFMEILHKHGMVEEHLVNTKDHHTYVFDFCSSYPGVQKNFIQFCVSHRLRPYVSSHPYKIKVNTTKKFFDEILYPYFVELDAASKRPICDKAKFIAKNNDVLYERIFSILDHIAYRPNYCVINKVSLAEYMNVSKDVIYRCLKKLVKHDIIIKLRKHGRPWAYRLKLEDEYSPRIISPSGQFIEIEMTASEKSLIKEYEEMHKDYFDKIGGTYMLTEREVLRLLGRYEEEEDDGND
jgi:Fe2+ or Zn2+ uptake regulation protein